MLYLKKGNFNGTEAFDKVKNIGKIYIYSAVYHKQLIFLFRTLYFCTRIYDLQSASRVIQNIDILTCKNTLDRKFYKLLLVTRDPAIY